MLENDAIAKLNDYIMSLYSGGSPAPLPDSSEFPEALRSVAESMSLLGSSIVETGRFSRQLSSGNLTADAPGRKNYLAGPLKELHSQLMGLNWSIKQLIDSNIVSKVFAPGELFENYNALIEKISNTLLRAERDDEQWGKAVNSWRYHQILAAMNQLHIMLIELDADGNVIYANPPARVMLDGTDNISAAASQENFALLEYLRSFEESSELLEPRVVVTDHFPVLKELYDPDSRTWYRITTDRSRLVGGSFGLLHMIDDISEWKEHESKLKRSAAIDSLTGAYTRTAGMLRLEELLQEKDGCVAFIDIDELKYINDTFGHNEGDYTIKTIAEIMIASVRKTDCVIRYGGDEFIIIFRNSAISVTNAAIDRMYARLDEINDSSVKPYTLSFSTGCMPINKHFGSTADLIAEVDDLMYRNKLERKKHKSS